jgi:hypothetical protein
MVEMRLGIAVFDAKYSKVKKNQVAFNLCSMRSNGVLRPGDGPENIYCVYVWSQTWESFGEAQGKVCRIVLMLRERTVPAVQHLRRPG